MEWKRTFRYLYLRFVRLRGTPQEISLGFAIGIFWGMFPLPGLQIAIAVLTAALLGSSKFAAMIGTLLGNPFTTLPLTALNLSVGFWIRGQSWQDFPLEQLQSPQGLFQLSGDVIISYLLGCLISGLGAGIISYFVGIPIVQRIQRRAHQRRLRRRRKRDR